MLKKTTLFILVLISLNGSAEELKHTVSAGFGFPNLPRFFLNTFSSENDFKSTGTGPFHLKYEYRLNRWIGVGLSINHMTYSVTYSKNALDTNNGRIVKNNVTASSNNTAFNLRTNIHFLDPETHPKSDFYFGFGIGYRTGKFMVDYTFKDDPVSIEPPAWLHLGLETTLGYRHFFDENLGIYTELGLAKSIVQFGFSGRF